ncbi:MAG TPA: Gfo/Idh/MocA family oxidoreductase [Thermomicrobiales bacterium]|nr:Gfo/Idh/MocA family oxidoreductase [Thermomicrobiales bacterium]
MTETSNETIRWGILGPGRIAAKFATGLQAAPGAELVAVGSRTQERADAFADTFAAPNRHASYEALAADPDVDVIYVATPHPQHMEATLLCLDHGKAVLCEKPFAMNVRQADRMVASAREKNLFLMEAMWTRFRPAIREAYKLIEEGAIGQPELLQVAVGWGSPFDLSSRLFNKELGGGILLDGGIYPISLASHFLGEPSAIVSLAHMAPSDVDDQGGVIFSYDSGAMASIVFSSRVTPHATATLVGTKGRIEIHEDWHKPTGLTLRRSDGTAEDFDFPLTEGNGYQYEALHVMECLRAGKTESDIMPLDETLTLMRTLDEIRRQWGLTYDADVEIETATAD